MLLAGNLAFISLLSGLATAKPVVTLLSAFGSDRVVFYDLDVVKYYYQVIKNLYEGYSWQIRASYGLILFSILLMIVLFFMFCHRVRVRTGRVRRNKRLHSLFADQFRQVLQEYEPLMPSQIEEICDCSHDEFRRYNLSSMTKLVTDIRQELQEVIYLPNLQTLCQVCGVTDFLENNLLNNRRVFETMQTLTTINLKISEGRLANYVNHRNMNIRHMARMSYMICTDMEPYRYLSEDLNETLAPWRFMALHQLFGWLQACEKRMPNFLTLVGRIHDAKVAAFVIEEIGYWGSDDDKNKLSTFFLDDRYECRSAAFKAVAMLRDASQEDSMIQTYNAQPEPLRREILSALYAIRSGNQVNFFNEVYHTTASKDTRELTLTYLYDYCEESRRVFEHIRFENNEKDRLLTDQIDSLNLLKQIREFS